MENYKRYKIKVKPQNNTNGHKWYYRNDSRPKEGQSYFDWRFGEEGRNLECAELIVNEHNNEIFKESYYYQGSCYVAKVDCEILEFLGSFDVLGRKMEDK